MSYEILDNGDIIYNDNYNMDNSNLELGEQEGTVININTWEYEEDFLDFVNSYIDYRNNNLELNESDIGITPYSISPSSSSYLSNTQLDLFDRILAGKNYRYYIAYRTGSDTYSAVMYACNKISKSGNTITFEKPMQFQLYRQYSGNTYYYYYTHTQLNNDSITLNNNILYYTNIEEGYPLLAEQGNSQINFSKDTILVFGVFLLLIIILFLRRRKNV